MSKGLDMDSIVPDTTTCFPSVLVERCEWEKLHWLVVRGWPMSPEQLGKPFCLAFAQHRNLDALELRGFGAAPGPASSSCRRAEQALGGAAVGDRARLPVRQAHCGVNLHRIQRRR